MVFKNVILKFSPLLFIAVLGVLCSASLVKGEGRNAFVIEGREYSRAELAAHFVSAAFNDYLWLERSAGLLRAIEIIENPKAKDISESWYRPYMVRAAGLPRHGVLNKWKGDVSVAIGWPSVGEINDSYSVADISQDHFFHKIVSGRVSSLKEKTGIKLRYIDSKEDAAAGELFAKIRIIPILGTGLFNDYKVDVVGAGQHSISNINSFNRIPGAVEFTPLSRAQVYGMYVPDVEGSISFASCRILISLPAKMISALVEECLIRSLGLPALSERAPHGSRLSEWNSKANAASKLPIYDGEEARDPFSHLRQKIDKDNQVDLREVGGSGYSDYDIKMLSILYCPSLKLGQDKVSTLYTLMKSDDCF